LGEINRHVNYNCLLVTKNNKLERKENNMFVEGVNRPYMKYALVRSFHYHWLEKKTAVSMRQYVSVNTEILSLCVENVKKSNRY
jgi:hypothetical protein